MNAQSISDRLQAQRATLEQMSVKSIALFGSTARGDDNSDSDIDILIEFSRPVGLFHFIEVKEFLEKVLGREVDLVTRAALKPQLRERILEEAVNGWR
jgi:hypothetical protein